MADTFGIELRHPWREDRADGQIGGKGLSNHRWIVGAKLGYVVNQYGLIVAWDYASANVADNAFRALVTDFADEMVIFTDMAFHTHGGRPAESESVQAWHVEWADGRRGGAVAADAGRRPQEAEPPHVANLAARLAYTMALFNVLVLWNGLPVDADGNVHLSIAEFAL